MGQAQSKSVGQLLAERGCTLLADGTCESLACEDCGAVALYLDDEGEQFTCAKCGSRFAALERVMRQPPQVRSLAETTAREISAGEPEAGTTGDGPSAGPLPHPETGAPAPQHLAGPVTGTAAAPLPRRTPLGEVLIIGFLATASFLAGLMAAGLSAWANHQAFGAMVEDPFQSRVWAWTGVIASICSFGGFTFVYWHFASGRRKEGLRAIAFALAGAVTSIVGTDMFMANLDMARRAEAEAAGARRPVLEAQIEDWRTQLDGIPASTRTVEGLEAYIAEVERVGRTHQKPYRDAKVELGQARRRAELEGEIQAARSELVRLEQESLQPAARRDIPSLFFAVMLEIFASQGTSVGLVALLILLGGPARSPPKG